MAEKEFDKDADDIVKEAADQVQDRDDGSVFSSTTLRRLVGDRFGQNEYREEALEAYNRRDMSRRDFLKIVGLAAGGVALGALAPGFFLNDRYFSTADGTITGKQAANAFNVAEDGGVSPGDDIASVINNNQGQEIVVPGDEYRIESTVNVKNGTTLMFNDTRITPASTNFNIFDCGGSDWHVGGSVAIDQSSAYPWVSLSGKGQFGDENGRISFRGQSPDDVIGEKRVSHPMWLVLSGSSSDVVAMKNVDQFEAPLGKECSDASFNWTTFPGTLRCIGCYFGNFHDNGFYHKKMRGRVELYDSFFRDQNVGMIRYGCDNGLLVKRCLTIDHSFYNAARKAGAHCQGVNHSMIAFQDGAGPSGDIMLDQAYYAKGPDPQGGEYLRNGPGDQGTNGTPTLTVKDSRWPGGPDNMGGGASLVNIQKEGTNGDNPLDHVERQGPYPLGGGGPNIDPVGDASTSAASTGQGQSAGDTGSPC